MPPQVEFTIPRPTTPVLKPDGTMRDEWFNFLLYALTNINATSPGPEGPNTAIQFNDNGSFGGDANLTWDKTNKVETVTGTPSYTPIVTPNTGGQLTSLGGPNQGFSVGSKVIGGVEIAQQANQGYAFFDGGTPVASLGFSTGETPGSPTAYTQWQELDVLPDRSADVVGDDTSGAIPGKSIGATRNAAGAGAASTLHGQQRSGTDWYIWQDATGAMRYGPARPTEDNSVSDTSGTPFGTGNVSFGSPFPVFRREGERGRMGIPGPTGLQGATGPTGPSGSGSIIPPRRNDDVTRVVMIGQASASVPSATGNWVPLALGTEPLQFVSDGAGNPIFTWFAP